MNRREFLSGVAACAVLAAVPKAPKMVIESAADDAYGVPFSVNFVPEDGFIGRYGTFSAWLRYEDGSRELVHFDEEDVVIVPKDGWVEDIILII